MPDLEKKDMIKWAVTFRQEAYNVIISVKQSEGKTYLAIITPEGIGTAIEIKDSDVIKLQSALDF